jgi:hypothetical protein
MKIDTIQDTARQLYLGIDVNLSTTDSNNRTFGEVLLTANEHIPDFEMCNERLLDRNMGHYHITIFNVAETAKIPALNVVQGMLLKNTSITFKGIGSLEQDGMITYFVIVESAILNKFRTDINLPEKDLHITIGFTHKDLFKGRKNNPNIFELTNNEYKL